MTEMKRTCAVKMRYEWMNEWMNKWMNEWMKNFITKFIFNFHNHIIEQNIYKQNYKFGNRVQENSKASESWP